MRTKELIFEAISKGEEVTLCKEEIELFLPHRGPAVKIDNARYDPNSPSNITVMKHVTIHDPDLKGHYPQRKMLPAHCMAECANLGAALLGMLRYGLEGLPMSGGFSIEAPKRTINPGETFYAEIQMTEERDGELNIFTALGYKMVNLRKKDVVAVTVKGKIREKK